MSPSSTLSLSLLCLLSLLSLWGACVSGREVSSEPTLSADIAAAHSHGGRKDGKESPLEWIMEAMPVSGFNAALLSLPVTLLAVWFMQQRSGSSKVTPTTGGSVSLPQTSSKSHSSYDTDVVIIGAGVAGASLGAALGKRGYRVIIVEQSLEEPSRIVGELLQPSGVQVLKQMGLPECLEGFDAQRVLGYGIFQGDTMLRLDYPKDPETGLGFEGRAFHNGRLLTALRKAVTDTKTAELRQGKVTAFVEQTPGGRVNGVKYRTREGEDKQVTAPLTVVCDGLFSSFNRTLTENQGQQRSSFLGMILRDVEYPLAQSGNVILAEPTPILLYPISSNEGRMLIDFPIGTLPNEKEAVKDFLLSHTIKQLPACVRPSFKRAVEDGCWSTMPNRQMGARPVARPGTLLIGDALNVRHPLTGGGMTVAFNDVNNVCRVLDAGMRDWNHIPKLDALIREHYATRDAPVSAINILADALYDVFGTKYGSLRAACFDYMSQGGEQAAGPVRLLSGISRSQMLLVSHFFAVAFWGCKNALYPFPTPSKLAHCYCMLRDANIIILPLLLQEHPGIPFRMVAAALRTIFWIPYRSYVTPREQ